MAEFDAFLAGFDNAEPASQADPAPAPVTDPAQVATPTADTAPKADPIQETTPAQPGTPPQGKTFTQAELDSIVERRLAREKAAAERQLKENPILSGLERVAQKSGMTPDQLIEALERQTIERLADEEGLSFEAAERLVKAEQRAAQLDAELAQRRTTDQAQEADAKDFAAFVESFPNVAPDAIPAEVWQARQQGKSLVDAYTAYESKSLRERISALETQLQNTKRAPISGGVGSHGTVVVEAEDPFLKGFDGH